MDDGGRARRRSQVTNGGHIGKAAVATIAAFGGACSADPGPVHGVAATPTAMAVASATTTATTTPSGPEYVLADLERRAPDTIVALEHGARGLLVDGARAVVSDAGVTFATETTDTTITRFERVPARLGGGFLFRTSSSLYASATFDGPLRPVVSVRASIASTSFGTDGVLVRSTTGERWMVDLATGARMAAAPMGLVDVAALDDGRAIAATEAGGASITSDGGKTWRDVRAQLQGAAGEVYAREGDVWLADRLAGGERALRLDRSGALVEMDAIPSLPRPAKQDPRFPSGDTPLRMALRTGVRAGPWSAVIAAGGDVMRVDLATGAIGQVAAGVVPLRMVCEAIEVPDDIAIVCNERGKASVVVTHVLHGHEPRVERSFPTDGPFYAGEGGALAYGGPCGPLPSEAPSTQPSGALATSAPVPPPPPLPTVCVRNGEGQWEPFVLDLESGKARSGSSKAPARPSASSTPTPSPTATGTSTAPNGPHGRVGSKPNAPPAPSAAPAVTSIRPEDVRWIPRPGRAPVAVLATKDLASYDSAWGELRPWQTQAAAKDLVEAARRQATVKHETPIIDQRWAATSSGAVQALLDDGRAIEVSPDGVITVWPFTFDEVAIAGPLAFAKGSGGRAFQTLDRGRTWGEVAAPPSPGNAVFKPRDCSPLGCDLGQWLRIGWNPSAPATRAELAKAQRPLTIGSPVLRELTCVGTGQTEARAATATQESPADLGLGAVRLPPHADDGSVQFETHAFSRAPVNVPMGLLGADVETAPRALQSGFVGALLPSDREDQPFGQLGTLGPQRAASAFRPEVAFVEPLVASAPLRRVTYTFDSVAKALKGSGVTVPALVMNGNLVVAAIVPVTPAPAAKSRTTPSGELLLSFQPSDLGTLYLAIRGGASPRADMLFAHPGGLVESAARLANGDLLALTIGDAGEEMILRFTASGVTEVATIPNAPSSANAPPNPDAIAVNAKGDIAVIRTPSGAEPPTAGDPALLILPGPRVSALAPWASAVTASDPACAGASDDAYRATIQTSGPWVRVGGRPFFDGSQSGMTARVRWSASRLCVEGLEIPEHPGIAGFGRTTETIVTATWSPDEAGRSDIELGSESRSALSCALQPR